MVAIIFSTSLKTRAPIRDYDFCNFIPAWWEVVRGLSMFKVVMPIKRKAGMSKAEFEAYYENNHRLIGEKYLRGYAHKYTRRYMHNLEDGSGVDQEEPQ